jgi:hypothetical protein
MFEDFPYLVTRVVLALYHIILLPGHFSKRELLYAAHRQVKANKLETALVLSADECFFFDEKATSYYSDEPPQCSIFIAGKLLPYGDFSHAPHMLEREERLDVFLEGFKRDAYIHGDSTKGGRQASEEELKMLSGFHADGIPNGLLYCKDCGELRGYCLDPSSNFEGMIMRVHCACENDNLCAYCGEQLHERKLNANYYGEDGLIWHVPGFCGLSHVCNEEDEEGDLLVS